MLEIALATSNPHKVQETSEILFSKGIKLISPAEFVEVVEDGTTFEANAEIKAIANSKLNGIYCVGEDSGLEVNALNGRPGVFSARFSEEDGKTLPRGERDLENNKKLLGLLSGQENRTGYYVCALALADPDGEIIYSGRGECELVVGHESRGEDGFGYDFICSPRAFAGKYFSELSAVEKNQISHRSKAWGKLIEFLKSQQLANADAPLSSKPVR